MENIFGVSFDTYKRIDGKVLFKPENSIWMGEADFEKFVSKKVRENFGIEYWANRNPYSVDGMLLHEAPTTVEIETEIAQFLY